MEYPLSYLKGAAVVLDAAPAASSLRNGQVGEVSEAGAVPRPPAAVHPSPHDSCAAQMWHDWCFQHVPGANGANGLYECLLCDPQQRKVNSKV